MTTPPVADPGYWETNYGISSAGELEDALGFLVPDVLPLVGPLGKTIVFQAAYQFPYGNAGTALRAAAAVSRLPAPDRPIAQPVLAEAILSLINATEGIAMSQLIIPDCFQVAINATCGTQEVVNVLGVRNAGGTAAGAAAAVKAAWEFSTTGPFSHVTTAYVVNNYRAVDISDPNGDIAVLGSTKAGGATGQIATAAACALIQWNGSTRSRSSRGRLYLGPLTESEINTDGRTIVAGVQTAITNTFVAFLGNLNSSGYPPVVLSRKLSSSFSITSAVCESQIATQRRRIRG